MVLRAQQKSPPIRRAFSSENVRLLFWMTRAGRGSLRRVAVVNTAFIAEVTAFLGLLVAVRVFPVLV